MMSSISKLTDQMASVAQQEGDPGGSSLGEKIYAMLDRFSVACLVLLLLVVAACAVLSSSQKPFWYDEIFTVLVATRPTWHGFFQALPPEGNPPLNTVLTRLCLALLGPSELVVRLPDLLGFLGALIGVYVFVRREVGSALAVLAATLVMAQPAWKYSYEARPYGLLLASLSLALVSWQAATRTVDLLQPGSRRLAFLGLGVGILGCVLAHDIGIVEVGVPLLAGEAVRSLRNRRLDWPLLAMGLVSVPALAVVIPMMRRTNQVVIAHARIWEPPLTISKLHAYALWARGSWALVMSTSLLTVVALAVLVSWVPGQLRFPGPAAERGPFRPRAVQSHIFAAAFGATLLIPVTWLAMLSAHGWYFCRYGIGSVLGVAILAALLLGTGARRNQALVVLLVSAGALIFADDFHLSLRELRIQRHRDQVVLEDQSELPMVISSPFDFPQIWWYAPGLERSRLVYLPYDPRLVPSIDLLQATTLAEKPIFGESIKEYQSFVASTPTFMLDVGAGGEELQARLSHDGCSLTPVRAGGTHHIFEVRCPPGA